MMISAAFWMLLHTQIFKQQHLIRDEDVVVDVLNDNTRGFSSAHYSGSDITVEATKKLSCFRRTHFPPLQHRLFDGVVSTTADQIFDI